MSTASRNGSRLALLTSSLKVWTQRVIALPKPVGTEAEGSTSHLLPSRPRSWQRRCQPFGGTPFTPAGPVVFRATRPISSRQPPLTS
jgi:hypothetical protein